MDLRFVKDQKELKYRNRSNEIVFCLTNLANVYRAAFGLFANELQKWKPRASLVSYVVERQQFAKPSTQQNFIEFAAERAALQRQLSQRPFGVPKAPSATPQFQTIPSPLHFIQPSRNLSTSFLLRFILLVPKPFPLFFHFLFRLLRKSNIKTTQSKKKTNFQIDKHKH